MLKSNYRTAFVAMLTLFATGPSHAVVAGIDGYAVAEKGYYAELHPCVDGVIATSERGNDITLLGTDGTIRQLLTSPGAGRYVNISPDGRTVGFKSINKRCQQSPALMDIATGAVKLLDVYSDTQCGQVSFANDGTMVWTRGNKLVVSRPGQARKELTMPFYTNIANISPDGTAVAFGHKTGDFYTMDLATGQYAKHGQNAGAFMPVWSPDGSKIAVRCADGKVFAVATADYERRYDLGEAKSLSWMPDSRQIVMTQSWRPNSELRCEGATVKVVNFDGTAEHNFVTNDVSVPSAVAADADGTLLISYATGQKRGITRMAVKTGASSRISAPAREITLLSLDADQKIGSVIGNKTAEAQYTKLTTDSLKPGMRRTGSLGLNAIPYHNQVYDTPVNYWGDTSWGYSACAPSSCCMNLGFWNAVSAWPSSSRYDGRTVNYANYIGLDYTSPYTGYTFDWRADGSGGGYGYMWSEGDSPRTSMVGFYQHNGYKAGQDQSWSSFNEECSLNYPYTLCVELGVSAGHVILGFRTDEAESNGSIYYCDGALICHDPYGDKNYAYPSYAGYYSSYDWPGYNNGHSNLGTFYWGVWARSQYTSPSSGGSTPAPTPSNPAISFSPNPVNFNCKVNEHPKATVTVTAQDLSSDITVASYTPGRFSTSVSTLPASGGSFQITFNISDKAGTYGPNGTAVNADFYVKLKSGSTEVKVPIRATVIEDKTISVSPSTLSLSCKFNNKATGSVTVTSKNLTDKISVTSDNPSVFSPSVTELPANGGQLTVTFKPARAGNANAKITLKSGTATQTISCSGNCPATPLNFTEKWNMSVIKNTNVAQGWDAAKVRNMDEKNGKLYLVYDHSDIKVVKATTNAAGSVLGNLNKLDVVKGGTLTLCDVRCWNDNIFACNLATTANNNTLRVYKWENDASAPELFLETTNWGGATRIGDCMGYAGDMTKGALYFANDDGTTTRVIKYRVTNGVASTTPEVINITTDGSKQLKTGPSTRVIHDYNPDGRFWIDGKDNYPTLCETNGQRLLQVETGSTWGNSLRGFVYEGIPYLVVTCYDAPSSDASKNYLHGRARVLNGDNGYDNATLVAELPDANGLSATERNINCTSNVWALVDGDCVQVWVQITNGGIAYYTSGGAEPTYNYETIPELSNDPSISVKQNSGAVATTAFEAYANKTTDSKTFTVKGSKLKGAINIVISGANASLFKVSPSAIIPDGGNVTATVTVNYTPVTEGNHTATLKFSSPGAKDVSIELAGTAKAEAALATEIKDLEQGWIFSANNGNLEHAEWFVNDGTAYPRSIAAKGTTLFVLNTKAYGSNHSLLAVDGTTGAQTAEMSLNGVTGIDPSLVDDAGKMISGGTIALSSIRVMGNDLVGCNSANGTSHQLRIYKWRNCTGNAIKIADLGPDAYDNMPAGDIMGTYGDLNNGRIAFSNGQKVVWFETSGGVVNATKHVITLDDNYLGNRSSDEVQFNADGTFWLVNKDIEPSLFNADGTLKEAMPATVGQTFGTAASFFEYGPNHKKYAAITTTLGGTENPAWGNGTIRIVDITDGAANATNVGKCYPANGFGDFNWGKNAGVTDVAVTLTNNDNSQVNVWGIVPEQGVAYYKFLGKGSSIVSDIAVDGASSDADAHVEFYNLQGVRMNADNLRPGIYIRRQGRTASKVLVK